MTNKLKFIAILFVIFAGLSLSGCGSSSGGVQVFTEPNQSPTANIVVEQLTNIGSTASVLLDGMGSFDPDNPSSDLNFTWTADSIIQCDGSAASCGSIEIVLSFGFHEIVLRVTDQEGAFDEASKTVILDPAQLSILEIDEAKVDFGDTPPEAEICGEIGLPLGVNYTELSPLATVNVYLAGLNILPFTPVSFVVEGGDDWTFRGGIGLTKFNIDWKGTRFKFVKHGFPVLLKSYFITTSETMLKVYINPHKIDGPFTMDFDDGQALVSFDGNGEVTSSSVPYDEQLTGKKIILTLPFPLTGSTVITFSGSLSKTINVEDNLKASIGRFCLDFDFDGSLFPVGSATTPRTLDIEMTIGSEGYYGETSLGSDDLKIHHNKWKTFDKWSCHYK